MSTLCHIEIQLKEAFEVLVGFPPLISWRSGCCPNIQIFTYIYICMDANLSPSSFSLISFLWKNTILAKRLQKKVLLHFDRFDIWICKNKAILGL